VPSPGAPRDSPDGRPLLHVSDLTVCFDTNASRLTAVDGVSFDVAPGEIFAIVGESGSGKSVTALSIMGLIGGGRGRIADGRIEFDGRDLVSEGERAWRELRGSQLSMIFQDPMTSLNPLFTVGDQIAEVLRIHRSINRSAALEAAIDMLAQVGIPNPKRRAQQYPHQFSGGMRQRAMIAMAMISEPRLLIADEPTTALDVTIQAQILELLAEIRDARGTAILLITHDLGVVAGFSDNVMVMYGGRAHELGPTDDIYYRSRGPYTWGLINTIPRLDGTPGVDLKPIRGSAPSIASILPGCRFAPRCEHAQAICHTTAPAVVELTETHRVACHFAGDAVWADAGRPPPPTPGKGRNPGGRDRTEAPLLELQGLARHIPVKGRGLLSSIDGYVKAVDGVDFQIHTGETVGLVGESGCGKTTTARLIMRLAEPTGGRILFHGEDIADFKGPKLKDYRKRVQLVYQDPYASLNPRLRVRDIVAEPMRIHDVDTSAAIERRAYELLEIVGLDADHADRYPHEFSGGQRQRIGIARALALQPELLILDEPVSALDVSIQAQVLNLLRSLQSEFDLTYLVIAHDLAVVRHMCERIAVMYLGRIVETGHRDALYGAPTHPYSQALLSAIPVPDPELERQRVRRLLVGDPPSPLDPPAGCAFHPRCWKAQPVCATSTPPLEPRDDGLAGSAACHFAGVDQPDPVTTR
jgi:peptide/nickel transport system ATP-binding protein